MFENVPVTVSAIISKNGKVLLGKRSENPWIGSYDLIGGFVEPGESLEIALKREIMEEINCSLLKCTYFGSMPETYNRRKILAIAFICEIEGTPEPNEEHTELIWTSDLTKVDCPSDKIFLQKFFSG